MPDLFESIVDQVTSKTLTGLLTKERQADIATIGKSWDYYNGDQEAYIQQYRGETDEDYDDKAKPTFNYTKLIIDEYVSGVFGKPVGVAYDDPKDTERWSEIASPISFVNQIPFMKKVQRISEISETCLVMIRWDKQRELPFFEDVRGEFITFVPREDNPKEIGTLIISYIFDTGIPTPSLRFMERIEIWNEERWEVWIHSPTTKKKEKIDGGDNPYGVIPAVMFRPEEDDNSFYGRGVTRDVVVINETYNNLWTSLVRISVMQSFSVMVITSEDEIKIEVAPTRYIKLPGVEKADVKYVTPDAKIEEVRKVLLSLKEDLQDFSRVPTSAFSSQASKGGPQSGYALKIKRIPIEEMWENRRTSYGPSYADLVGLAMYVDGIHRGKGGSDKFLMEKPTIAFTSTIPGLSPQEQIIQDQFDLRYNLLTPVDLYQREHPGLSREDALTALLQNQAENTKLGITTFFAPTGTDINDDLGAILTRDEAAGNDKPKGNEDDLDTPTGGEEV